MARTSGFLLPEIGESSTKGFILGESAYWAINRSSDIMLGTQYFSKRGWSETAQFRGKPAENSSLELHYFGVQDRGAPVTGQDQGGEEVRLTRRYQPRPLARCRKHRLSQFIPLPAGVFGDLSRRR